MNVDKLAKLRAGQTLYVVNLEQGLVLALYVKKAEIFDGSPAVTGDAWVIMNMGIPAIQCELTKDYGIWFCMDEETARTHRHTTSKKQAMRWAKEGFMLYGKPKKMEIVWNVAMNSETGEVVAQQEG